MKILLASSEVHPYSKTGGLADMVGALGKYLARAGEEVRLVTPFYPGIRERWPNLKLLDLRFEVSLGTRTVDARIWTLELANNEVVYFVDQAAYFARPSLYQEHGHEYGDNAERFIFFSKCVAYLARYLLWQPDILHLHDWQTGLVPLLVRHEKERHGWHTAPKTCFTIHNLAYQGHYSPTAYTLTNLPWNYFTADGAEFYGGFNLLKTGIIYADLITTVSPRYAREILTPEFGCGLEPVLQARQSKLRGILNGVDYTEWNSTENPYLAAPFQIDALEGKAVGKAALQKELDLPVDPDIPLFGSVTRLADQKGIDITLEALREMLKTPIQFALLGSGQPEFETAFEQLAADFPNQVKVKIGYDPGLAHRIEAGCDFFLMPSKFEPCGLNQMYSLRYGTIPVVRATGGLDDTVVDLTASVELANGIKFTQYSVPALVKAMQKAVAIFQTPELLAHYRRNGMACDFSWDRTAAEYVREYERLLEDG